MLSVPAYATDWDWVDAPLTEAPCLWAPEKGIHLYHFPLSLDSQKVRQGLEELGLAWQSHVILLPAQQQFEPRYARINSRCVVPTLFTDGRVTTDTVNILSHLANRFGGQNDGLTIAEDETTAVNEWIDKASSLFIEALTYGDVRGIKKPFPFGGNHKSGQYHQDKLQLLSKLIQDYKDDAYLRAAYEKKQAVIEATRAAIVTPSQMEAIIESTRAAMGQLEAQLQQGPFGSGGWLASEAFSLADIQWGAVLYRLRWLGLQRVLWPNEASITAYSDRLFARPSFQRGVVKWSRVGRNVVLPMLRFKLLKVMGLKPDI